MSSDTFIPTPELRQFLDLKEQISACRYCQEGFEPRPIVFGNLDAKIMQISQAPSCTAHNTGKPFDDASDRRLRSEWYKIPDNIFYNPDNMKWFRDYPKFEKNESGKYRIQSIIY